MENERGVERGSYIWGGSVDNTWIERVWYDVTHGFGYKWKTFFADLEANHHLNSTQPTHIWLLHHLFLPSINDDAQEWAASWNNHPLQIRGERTRPPRDIWFFSQIQDGARGLERIVNPTERDGDDVQDPSTYGIDWEVADDPALMTHLLDENPQEWDEGNPFTLAPDQLSDVPCEPPDSPFTLEQITFLDEQLAANVNLASRSMVVRTSVWNVAYRICSSFFE
ncbi:hypothetical protein FB45DRAFT_750837 [Roridomyces roridus]|uniref:Integrase core domain-containing protein n=1 Tax=Roridomyces roridus TaxID=1738132 RepID=A0AAD7BNU4_9AGAR|nr:hypothetical protein FB45DRAFT_750837 [Roridomyces roridus]